MPTYGFYVLFHVIITNEAPATILQAYISLPRHIRKGMLIRRIIASHLCTAVGYQQFRKAWRKYQRRIMFESTVIIPFTVIVCCLVVTRHSKNSILSKSKWGAQAVVRGGTASLAPL